MSLIRSIIKRPLFWVICSILLGFTAFLVIGGLPATGTIHNNLSTADLKRLTNASNASVKKQMPLDAAYEEAQQEEKKQTAAPDTFDGQYFKLTYPSWYTVKEHDRTSQNQLEKLILVTAGSFSDHMTITIQNTQAAKLSDIPSVALRIQKSDIYKETPVTIAGQRGLMFTSESDGYEKIAFVLWQGKLTTIALVTSGDKDTNGAFKSLLASFQWKPM